MEYCFILQSHGMKLGENSQYKGQVYIYTLFLL